MVSHVIGDTSHRLLGSAAEMADIIGTLVSLGGFSAELKARKEGRTGPVCMDSCELLMPSVGEIVGEWCNISTRTGS